MNAEKLDQVRPTKKQKALLDFIAKFISEHGYGPSYREIMVGCDYTSVATVSAHVNNLIARGHLIKKGRNARSLEIVNTETTLQPKLQTNVVEPSEEKWLIEKVEYQFKLVDEQQEISINQLNSLQTLVEALKILGMDAAASSFQPKIQTLKKRLN